jgi:hypothetical protein
MFGNNLFLDNCGGWGGDDGSPNEGYNSMLLEGTSRIVFTNMNLFGETGIYGGQDSGIYLANVGFSSFSNFQIDGFEDSSIRVSGATRLNFNNFDLVNAGSHPIQITSETDYKVEDIAISNFKILVSNSSDGIGIYAQNSQNVKGVTITNGLISGTGDGIVLNDDSGGAVCTDISVSNVNIDVTGYGISEGGSSDYNMFSNINARTCPSGIYTTGANTKVTDSWNYTTFIQGTSDTLSFTTGTGGVSANDIVACQADNTVYKAKFTTNGEKVIGVAQQTKTVGQAVLVKVYGTATVIADSAINSGDRIAASDTNAGRGVEWNSHAHTVSIQASTEGNHNHSDTAVDGNHQHGSGTLASSGSNDLTHHHDVYVASTPSTVDSSDGLGTRTITGAVSGSTDTAGSHQHSTYDGGSHYHTVSGNTGSFSNGMVIGKALTSAAGAGSSFTMIITHGT